MLKCILEVIIICAFSYSCSPPKKLEPSANYPSLTFSQFRLYVFEPAVVSDQLIVVELGIDLPANKVRDTIYALDYGLQWHASIYAGRDKSHGCDQSKFYYAYKNINNIKPDSILIFTTKPFKTPGVVYHLLPITNAKTRGEILKNIVKSGLDTVFKLDSNSVLQCNNNPDTSLINLVSIKDTLYKFTIECSTGWDGGIRGNKLVALLRCQNDMIEVLHTSYIHSDDIYTGKFDGYIDYHWVANLDNDKYFEIQYSVYKGDGVSWKYITQLNNNNFIQSPYLLKTNGEAECNQYPESIGNLFLK